MKVLGLGLWLPPPSLCVPPARRSCDVKPTAPLERMLALAQSLGITWPNPSPDPIQVGDSGGIGSPSEAPSPSSPEANTLRLSTRARPSMVLLRSSPSGHRVGWRSWALASFLAKPYSPRLRSYPTWSCDVSPAPAPLEWRLALAQ